MQTFNKIYENKEDLNLFIINNNIEKYENTLLQIFTGHCDKQYINNLIISIKELLPNINIIGSTTDGEIINDEITNNKTIMAFSVFDNTKVDIHTSEFIHSSYESATNLIGKINDIEKVKVAIVFTDGLKINGESFLNAFNDLAPNISVSGGLSGDNGAFNKTYVFTQDGFVDDFSVMAVLYNENLIVNTTYSFGWKTIGKEFTITQVEKNRVYKIDDKTPVQIYEKYLGKNIRLQLPSTGIEFPLILNRDGVDIARAVISKEKDGSLVFAGNINMGDKVHLGYGNLSNIIENIPNTYSDMLSESSQSIFIYSCMSRKKLFGDDILNEIIPFSKIATTSGFFTYGEFYKDNSNKLFNQTMTILSLSENNEKNNVKYSHKYNLIQKNTQTIEALSHLINQTTDELNIANKMLEKNVKIVKEENKQKDIQMFNQSKHALMGEMISMIAHQWRQPLSSINGTSVAIGLKARLGKLDNELAIRLSNNISEYSQHLSRTIDDFRYFFKSNKLKAYTTYDNVINKVLSILSVPISNKNIEIILQLDCKSKFLVYENELQQVIINLIKNAEDILLENDTLNPYIKITTYGKNKKAVLEISDNAGGIPLDIINKIYDPYFSTKLEKDGTGLGLYMSKIIIEEHCEGKLSVYNNSEGAVFKIELDNE